MSMFALPKHPAWRCFSVKTKTRTYDFCSNDDDFPINFVYCLQRLVNLSGRYHRVHSKVELILQRCDAYGENAPHSKHPCST